MVYDGEPLPVADSFVYLGVRFCADAGAGQLGDANIERNLGKAAATVGAVHTRCAQLGIHELAVRGYLFNTLVAPVINYGCEVWAVYALSGALSPGAQAWGCKGPAEELHRTYMRCCMGLKQSTPMAGMYDLTGRHPMAHDWLARVLGWWNGIVGRAADDVVRVALKDSMAMHSTRRGRDFTPWAKALRGTLHMLALEMPLTPCPAEVDALRTELGYEGSPAAWEPPAPPTPDTWVPAVESVSTLPASDITTKLAKLWTASLWHPAKTVAAVMEGHLGVCAVRAVPNTLSAGFKGYVYQQWFQSPFVAGQGLPYCVCRRQRVQAIARFVLGSHDLEIERGRAVRCPRDRRVCRCCDSRVREDEMHLLLECPAYETLRAAAPKLFANLEGLSPDEAMRRVMCGGSDWEHYNQMGDFLIKAFAIRRQHEREPHGQRSLQPQSHAMRDARDATGGDGVGREEGREA
jgi:hypothetical protein